MDNFDELYNKLNKDQKSAVDQLEGPVLVIAGPGTGKTQVLALRIVNILKTTDTDPASILCLTFQDASVLAMRKRLASFIGNDAYKVNIHTFHSFCNEIITTFPEEFDFGKDVEAIKEIDKLNLFKEILVENKLISLQQRNDILGNFKSLVSVVSNLKKEFITPEYLDKSIDRLENDLDDKNRKMMQRKIDKMRDISIFYKEYLKVMQDRNMIDFDDMIFKVTTKFNEDEKFVKFFQEQYLYTLVDEFQDTNTAQLKVIESVSNFEGLVPNIFAVGDDDQTIFRFQGANSDNFERFLEIFPDTSIVVLHTNYRSNQKIIDAASNIINNNEARLTESDWFKKIGLNKDFVSGIEESKSSNANVYIHSFEHSFHEDYWIGQKIKELIESGEKPNDIALIARVNSQITNVTKFLDKFDLKYIIKRSESILDDQYTQSIIQLVKVISDPDLLKKDQVVWELLSSTILSLNSFDVFGVYHKAKKEKKSIYDFIAENSSGLINDYTDIKDIFNKIILLQNYALNNSFLNTLTKIIHTFDIIKVLENTDHPFARLNRLSSLYQFVTSRSRANKDYSIDIFLEEVMLMQEKNIIIAADPIEEDPENRVNLITAHSSKGLEFKHVFIYQGVEDKWEKYMGGRNQIVLPAFDEDSLKADDDKELKQIDERRLFYVAATRAKSNLYITYSKRYYSSDTGEVDVKEKMPSKFITETGVKNTYHHGEMVKEHTEISKILMINDDKIDIPDDNKKYLSDIIHNHLSLSASKVNKYEKCAYKFLLEDVFTLPTPRSLNLEIGSAVHKGIEELTKSCSDRFGKVRYLTFDQVYEIAKKEFEQNLASDMIDIEEIGSIDVAYEEIKRGLKAYYDYFSRNPEKPHFSEFISSGTFNSIKLRGRLDKVSKIDKKDYQMHFVVTDYKTTSLTPTITNFLGVTASSDAAHLRQLLFYRLLLESSTEYRAKAYAKDLEELKVEYIDTKEGTVTSYSMPAKGVFEYHPRKNSKKTAEFDVDAEYDKLKEDIQSTYESILNLKFDRTTNLKHCQYCPFKRHCGR